MRRESDTLVEAVKITDVIIENSDQVQYPNRRENAVSAREISPSLLEKVNVSTGIVGECRCFYWRSTQSARKRNQKML